MITRIVKMSFMPEKVEDFKQLFELYKTKIAAAEGCLSLQLLQTHQSSIFFTLSQWQEDKYLQQYRQSPLFAVVWSQTKTLFNAKPEAWTNDILFNSEAIL